VVISRDGCYGKCITTYKCTVAIVSFTPKILPPTTTKPTTTNVLELSITYSTPLNIHDCTTIAMVKDKIPANVVEHVDKSTMDRFIDSCRINKTLSQLSINDNDIYAIFIQYLNNIYLGSRQSQKDIDIILLRTLLKMSNTNIFPEITRATAEEKLKSQPVGSWLLRQSSVKTKPNDTLCVARVLSYRAERNIEHKIIIYIDGFGYFLPYSSKADVTLASSNNLTGYLPPMTTPPTILRLLLIVLIQLIVLINLSLVILRLQLLDSLYSQMPSN